MSTGGGQVGGGGGKRELQHYGPRARNGLPMLILVPGQPRAGAETSGKAISRNRPPTEGRSTI